MGLTGGVWCGVYDVSGEPVAGGGFRFMFGYPVAGSRRRLMETYFSGGLVYIK